MATDRTAPGAARIVKTARVQHLVTSNEGPSSLVIDVPWDTPFTDLNYTADQNVEVLPPGDPFNVYVAGFVRAVDKVTVTIGISPAVFGNVLVIHSHGIHD